MKAKLSLLIASAALLLCSFPAKASPPCITNLYCYVQCHPSWCSDQASWSYSVQGGATNQPVPFNSWGQCGYSGMGLLSASCTNGIVTLSVSAGCCAPHTQAYVTIVWQCTGLPPCNGTGNSTTLSLSGGMSGMNFHICQDPNSSGCAVTAIKDAEWSACQF